MLQSGMGHTPFGLVTIHWLTSTRLLWKNLVVAHRSIGRMLFSRDTGLPSSSTYFSKNKKFIILPKTMNLVWAKIWLQVSRCLVNFLSSGSLELREEGTYSVGSTISAVAAS